MLSDRVRYLPLQDKITDAATAAKHIKDGMTIMVSGFSPAGYPKLIPAELAKRAQSGEKLSINLCAGASTAEDLDGVMARAGVVKKRWPYMGDRIMRGEINKGKIEYQDIHLSQFAEKVRSGLMGPCDVAVVEAVSITPKGHIIPTMSVGNTPTFVRIADTNHHRDVGLLASGDGRYPRHLYSRVIRPTGCPSPSTALRTGSASRISRWTPTRWWGSFSPRDATACPIFPAPGRGLAADSSTDSGFHQPRDKEGPPAARTALAVRSGRCGQRRAGRIPGR